MSFKLSQYNESNRQINLFEYLRDNSRQIVFYMSFSFLSVKASLLFIIQNLLLDGVLFDEPSDSDKSDWVIH